MVLGPREILQLAMMWGCITYIGGLVALADPSLGREMALRLPFCVAACGATALWIYAILCLKLKDET